MHPHVCEYELTDAIDVPEIAPLPSIRSERARTVAKWFGIHEQCSNPQPESADQRTDRALLRSLLPRAGQITFLTGPSGAGKSSMLRALRSLRPRARWVDLNTIQPPDLPLVDCFGDAELDQTLALLSQVGLAEAWSYLRTPKELSEGQRWRLKLALGVRASGRMEERSALNLRDSSSLSPDPRALSPLPPQAPQTRGLKPARQKPARQKCAVRAILLADEFAALLDRVTASVVARSLRRAVDSTPRLCAIVATSHQDLTSALYPDVIVNCDFRRIDVHRRRVGSSVVVRASLPRQNKKRRV